VRRRGPWIENLVAADDSAPPRDSDAPGQPGIPPTWTSSAKDFVGCSIGPSRLWFTTGFGIVNEVYWPRVDIPQIRDLGFIIADGSGFWVEVKRNADYTLRLVAPGVPALEIAHHHARFQLRLRISPDPRRDVLALEIRLEGDEMLRPYVLLAPHLGATGHENRGEIARYRGRRVLWAEQGPFACALAAVDELQGDAFGDASAGYVGTSDGWQDFAHNGAMRWTYPAAGPGNIALMAALPRRAVAALGFGSSPISAATLAITALLQPFDNLLQQQIADWEAWQSRRSERSAVPLDLPEPVRRQFSVSSIVLRSHLDKTFPGAMVASLSVPWGDSGDERGGYHLVWPRDLVQCAGALLALGAEREARDTLRYLIATQHADGRWNQNQWLGGHAYWTGLQLDEIAFPVLLAAELGEREALGGIVVETMIRRALGYIALHGPASDQDRWEENHGLNPYTLAIAIAALVGGAELIHGSARHCALALADFWNANIERWLFARDTQAAAAAGVEGHYVRIAPLEVLRNRAALQQKVVIRNRVGLDLPAAEQIGTEFLQLVRFGLRRPNDPAIRASLAVVDRLLRVETPAGPVWRRYNGDGYGEHEDGRAYDGLGVGRPWPLLTGERGHFELAAGRDPLPYLETMAAMTSPGGMLPEQVWDGEPVPARRLVFGGATGSAMPLAWAHAEFVKLLASRGLGRPFDRPDAVWRRYKGRRRAAVRAFWTPAAEIVAIDAGQRLVVLLPRAARVHWGIDGWRNAADVATEESGLGTHVAELDASALTPGQASTSLGARKRTDNGSGATSGSRSGRRNSKLPSRSRGSAGGREQCYETAALPSPSPLREFAPASGGGTGAVRP
jgi:glucoamylase